MTIGRIYIRIWKGSCKGALMCSFALFLLKYTEAGFLLPVEEKRKEFCRERIAYYLSASSCRGQEDEEEVVEFISGCLSAMSGR